MLWYLALLPPQQCAEDSGAAARHWPDLALAPCPLAWAADDYRIIKNIDPDQIPEQLKKDCVLFYTPHTEALARKIAAEGERVELGNIRWK